MSRAAMQQALEALEWNHKTDLDNIPACERWAKMSKETMAALRAALAEPEQEPWICACGADSYRACKCALKIFPRKPLSDDQIALISVECAATHKHDDLAFARAIEKAHGIGDSNGS